MQRLYTFVYSGFERESEEKLLNAERSLSGGFRRRRASGLS